MNKAMKTSAVMVTAIALNCLVLPGGAEQAQPGSIAVDQQEVVKPDPTLVQQLRELLNITPPLAVGGSRTGASSISTSSVCLISPRPFNQAQRAAVANVITAKPTILVAGSLNEIQLQRDRGVRTTWIQQASSTDAINGAIAWPLQPLEPGDVVKLKLRPRGNAGGQSVSIELRAGSLEDLQRTESLIKELGGDIDQWQAAIIEQQKSNPALALALATAPEAPVAIRTAVAGLDCGEVSQ